MSKKKNKKSEQTESKLTISKNNDTAEEITEANQTEEAAAIDEAAENTAVTESTENTDNEASESPENELESIADEIPVEEPEEVSVSDTESTSEEKSDEDTEEKAKDESEEKSAKKPETEKKKTDEKKSAEKAEKKAARKSKRALKERAFKRGWFSVVLVVLFIAAVIILNIIAMTLNEKIPALTFDTTGTDSFELSQDTLDYLAKLDQDIKIIVLGEEMDFKNGGEYYIQANTLLHEYENNSDHITIEYVDMSTNPTFSSKYPNETLSYYGVIVQGENDYKYLTEHDMFDIQIDYNTYNYYIAGSMVEQAVTSAILYDTIADKPKVTFVSDINGQDYDFFKNYLETNGFETAEVSPAVGDIPEDTAVLVLYDPTVDLNEAFVNRISEFLNNNGKLGKQLLYVAPSALKEFPNIDSLLEEWDIAVENGYALENDTSYMAPLGNSLYLFATQYKDMSYTTGMKNTSLPFCVISSFTKPVKILDETNTNVSALMTLSDKSSVVYPTDTGDEAKSEKVDTPNVNIGVISKKKSTENTSSDSGETANKESDIIVIGCSLGLDESLLRSAVYGNSSYIISVLNSVTGRGDVGISIEAKSLTTKELGITSAQINVLGTLFIVLLPILVIVVGFVIFMKRRNM